MKSLICPGSFGRPNGEDPEVFYRLARYQVKRESPVDIARGSDIDGCWSSDGITGSERKTLSHKRVVSIQRVRKAISRLATFIGLRSKI